MRCIVPGLFVLIAACGGGSSDSDSNSEDASNEMPLSENPVEQEPDVPSPEDASNPPQPSDNPDIDSGAGFLQTGTVFFSQSLSQNELFISASFAEFETRFNPETQGRPQLGECFYFGPGSADFNSGQQEPSSPGFTPISAGEVIVVNSVNGTYVNLPRTTSEFGIFYSDPVDVPLPLPSPDNLTVDIPGDEFPAFQAVSVPVIPPLVVTQPESSGTLNAATVYQWVPGSSGQSVITLNLFAEDDNFSMLARCETEDDGEFTLPSDIQMSIGDIEISGISSIARVARVAEINNDSRLEIDVSSSQRLGSL